MPSPQLRQKRQKAVKQSVKAPSAKAVARVVVEGLKKLAPMSHKTVVSAFRVALPERKSAEVIHIARLLVDLEPARKRSTSVPAAKGGAAVDPLIVQANEARRTLLASRQIVPSKEICSTLDFSRQALSKAVKEHRMFSVSIGHNRLYPAFFADTGLDRQQLENVARELGTLPGWSKWSFFTTPKASLNGATPIEALKSGRYTETRRAAVGFADI